jgi:hypothetical protein
MQLDAWRASSHAQRPRGQIPRRHARSVAFALVIGALWFASAPALSQSETLGGGLTFVVEADLNGDGRAEVIIGTGALGADRIAEFAEPGDVYVYERAGVSLTGVLAEVYRCRAGVPEDLLPGFFEASVVTVADVDGDSLPEVVLVWLEQFWWPVAYRPLAVLQFDPIAGAYEMAIDVERFVGEIGGYAAEDADADGRVEIVEIDPVYGSEINPEDGTEEWECHFCPHCYKLSIFEFDGARFLVDLAFNGGKPFVTPEKFEPGTSGGVASEFLPRLLEYVRALVSR